MNLNKYIYNSSKKYRCEQARISISKCKVKWTPISIIRCTNWIVYSCIGAELQSSCWITHLVIAHSRLSANHIICHALSRPNERVQLLVVEDAITPGGASSVHVLVHIDMVLHERITGRELLGELVQANATVCHLSQELIYLVIWFVLIYKQGIKTRRSCIFEKLNLLNISIFADIIFNSEKMTNLKRQ